MKKKVEDLISAKIMDIEQEMERLHTKPLYHLRQDWAIMSAQVRLLNELLTEVKKLK